MMTSACNEDAGFGLIIQGGGQLCFSQLFLQKLRLGPELQDRLDLPPSHRLPPRLNSMDGPVKIEDDDEVNSNFRHNKPVDKNPLRPLGPSPPFRELCKMLDALVAVKKVREPARRLHRRECLKQFFDTWRKVYGNDLYPCIRLLLPERDRERSPYCLREDGLAQLYLNALGLDKESSSVAKLLLDWKRVSRAGNQSTVGDFAKLLSTVIESRISVGPTPLSIHEINTQLDSLAMADSGKKLEIVKFWLDQVSPGDHLWLLRLILKDLRLGLSEHVVLAFVHHRALELFNVCTDLRVVCRTLHSPQVFLEDPQSSLKVFTVFKPMLSKRSHKDLPDVVKLMLSDKSSEFLIEEKMDGERMQFHKSGEQYRFWSRNGKEYTNLYGSTPMSGCLTPFIHHAFKPAVEEVILDGEILAWDPITEKILPFGTVKSLKSSSSGAHGQPRALFKVFDILYLKGKGKANGTNLMNKPLCERRKVLESGRVFEETKSRLELCYSVRGKTVEDIKTSFEKIMDERGEGLIIKRLVSKYLLNSRTNDWIKVKPDYMDELGETFEVLAVGGSWGRGKRGGKFGSLLVALVDDDNSNPLEGSYHFKTLCRVGTGLNVDEMERIRVKLEGKCQDWDKKRPERNPDWLDIGGTAGNSPDVWWHWRDSFLLTIKGAEIIPSSCYGCRLSVRFPRSIRFDEEKDLADCMSYQELLAVTARLPDKRKFGDDLSAHVKKRQRIDTMSQPLSSLRGLKRSDSDKIFYGAEFWILQGLEGTNESKNDLEVIVNENGGKIIHTVPRPSPDRDRFCISLRADFWDAEKVLRQGLNLIHPQWIIDSVQAGHRISLTDPKYGIQTVQSRDSACTVKDVDSVILSEYDEDMNDVKNSTDGLNVELSDEEGGDNYLQGSRDASVASDEENFEHNSLNKSSDSQTPIDSYTCTSDHRQIPKETSSKIHSWDAGLTEKTGPLEQESPLEETAPMEDGREEIFYPLVFYLDIKPSMTLSSGLSSHQELDRIGEDSKRVFSDVQELIESNGGKITANLDDPHLTHIICSQGDTSRCLELMRTNHNRPKRRRLVLTDWVFESVESSTCLYEADYLPVF